MEENKCKRFLKLTCLILICVQWALGWVRFAEIYYQAKSEKSDFIGIWIIYCFFPGISTMFLPIQLHYLILEVKTDLVLFKTRFKRLYVMIILMFFMYLYETMGYQIIYYLAYAKAADAVSKRHFARDIIDGIAGCVYIVLLLLILFRPMFTKSRDALRTDAIDDSRYSVKYMKHEDLAYDIQPHTEDGVSVCRKVSFGFLCVLTFLYIGGFVSVCVFMFYLNW